MLIPTDPSRPLGKPVDAQVSHLLISGRSRYESQWAPEFWGLDRTCRARDNRVVLGRPAAGLGIFLALLTVVACSVAPPVTPSPTIAPSPTVATPPAPTASASPTASPAPSPTEVMTTFTSPRYGYSVAVGQSWMITPAAASWGGNGAPSHESAFVDLILTGPDPQPLFWGYSAAFEGTVDALTAQLLAADAADHPCPPAAESQQPTTIDREPAVIVSKHCPSGTGILVLSAFVIKEGKGYEFYMQDPRNDRAVEPADNEAFASFVASILLP
jgi:hypothetical protein